MSNQNLYQPTAEELDALWEKGATRDNPCLRPHCKECTELKARRMAALLQIINHAQQYQADTLARGVTCIFCLSQVPTAEAHLHQGKWVGPCCWDERLRTTA
jgi:hypothetical protein